MDYSPVVSVEFGQGLDSKTDYKVTAKPVLVQDGIFTNPRRISKRNGYDSLSLSLVGGGSISNPTMNKSYKSVLVCAATGSSGNRLFSYSPSLNAWADNGKYYSVAVSKQNIASQLFGQNFSGGNAVGTLNSSVATLNNISLFAFNQTNGTSGASSVAISVVDQSTGTTLLAPTLISSLSSIARYPTAIVLGGSQLAVIYNQVSTGKLVLRPITVTALGGVVIGAESSAIFSSSAAFYSAQPTSTGAAIAVTTGSTSITVVTIDTAGTVTHTATLAYASGGNSVSVVVDTAANIWVYFSDGASTFYAVYTSTLSVTLAKTTLIAKTSFKITSYSLSSTQQQVFFSFFTASSVGSSQYATIQKITATTGGSVGAASNLILNADIYSAPASLNSVNYMAVMALSPLNPTGFILDLSDGLPVAKFLPDRAEGIYDASASVDGRRKLINPLTVSGNTLILCGAEVVDLSTLANSSVTGRTETVTGINYGCTLHTFDFNHIDAYQALQENDTLVLNGGIVSQFDGSAVSELGFSTDPDNFTISASASGGNIATGQWVYYFVYEWIDALGNLHQSAPSIGYIVNFSSGTTNSVTAYVQSLTLTQKSGVNVVLYKTISNGTIAYRFTSVPNSTSANETTVIVDTGAVSDATLQLRPPLYTAGGAILENIAPPPSMILWANKTRVWAVDSENPETTIEYAKTSSQGTGICFSRGLLEYVIDSRLGNITGASPMDEKTVILKASGLGYTVGDGANDAGGGSTLIPLEFIPSDTGCSNSKSVISYPNGILFRASNNKGIYLLSRGTKVEYFGMDVEAYNSQDIRSALIVGNKNQIRFLTSSGSSLLYDYVMNQWSVFTNHSGLAADTYNGSYVYVRADGLIYSENTTTFLDNASSYGLKAKLQFIKAQSIQNFQRMRRIELLGDYQNGSSQGHGVQISSAYDFGTTFSIPVPETFGASSSSGSFQYREILPRQKCNAIQLFIEEVVTGASGEYVDFTDLGIEIALKRGLNKLPGSRSVG